MHVHVTLHAGLSNQANLGIFDCLVNYVIPSIAANSRAKGGNRLVKDFCQGKLRITFAGERELQWE